MALPSEEKTINGVNIKVAILETVDIDKLARSDPDEVSKLMRVGKMPGFFYATLPQKHQRLAVNGFHTIYSNLEQYFDQPLERKMAAARGNSRSGYGNEFPPDFDILQNELDRNEVSLPDILNDIQSDIFQSVEASRFMGQTILSAVSDVLKRRNDDRIEKKNDLGRASNTLMKMMYGPSLSSAADMPETKHTDEGLLTLTYHDAWTMMLEQPESKEWFYIEPKKDRPIVGIGDTLQRETEGRLHSCVHRVTQVGDGMQKRYFLAYYMRPPEDAAAS